MALTNHPASPTLLLLLLAIPGVAADPEDSAEPVTDGLKDLGVELCYPPRCDVVSIPPPGLHRECLCL